MTNDQARMTKIINLMLLCLAGVLIACRPNSTSLKPVFDSDLGLLEPQVITRYGKPESTRKGNASEICVGELAYDLRFRLPAGNTNLPVMQIYYRGSTGERIFWLTNSSGTNWTVFADVNIPPGTMF